MEPDAVRFIALSLSLSLFDLALLALVVVAVGGGLLTVSSRIRESRAGTAIHRSVVISIPVIIGAVAVIAGMVVFGSLSSS